MADHRELAWVVITRALSGTIDRFAFLGLILVVLLEVDRVLR